MVYQEQEIRRLEGSDHCQAQSSQDGEMGEKECFGGAGFLDGIPRWLPNLLIRLTNTLIDVKRLMVRAFEMAPGSRDERGGRNDSGCWASRYETPAGKSLDARQDVG
jgi:hypothetical protein